MVVFQTFNPEFSAIQTAKEQDYKKFYEEEIKLRKEFDYPPFSQVIRFLISGADEKRTSQAAEEISEHFKIIINKKNLENDIKISSASSCAIEKLNNEYRYEILIKNLAEKKGHQFISRFFKNIRLPKDLKIKIDVNPIDLI